MDVIRCGGCAEPYEVHCNAPACTWVICHSCQSIVGVGLIPTWERYEAEGRGGAR